MSDVVKTTRSTLVEFCLDFLRWPYLCYTEHGLHALFFTRLYDALGSEERYSELNGQRFCVVQKEYPTAGNLGRSKRQHWDVSVIRHPVIVPVRTSAFDYLPLAAAIEFGLNCDSHHLEDDIQRLSHCESNVQNGFVCAYVSYIKKILWPRLVSGYGDFGQAVSSDDASRLYGTASAGGFIWYCRHNEAT
jgi:hypothetical protein